RALRLAPSHRQIAKSIGRMGSPIVKRYVFKYFSLLIVFLPVLLEGLDALFAALTIELAASDRLARCSDAVRYRVLDYDLGIETETSHLFDAGSSGLEFSDFSIVRYVVNA